jgi:hypothetical protein
MDERDLDTAVFVPTQVTTPPKQDSVTIKRDAVTISRLTLKVFAIAILCSFFGALTASGSPAHGGRTSSACSAHRKHAVAVGPQMIVYAKRSGSRNGAGALTTYYACTPPAGKPVVVGHSEEGEEYPGELSFSDVRIAGTYVVHLSGSGFGGASACSKYEGANPRCEEEVKWWVQVTNVKTHRGLRAAAGVTQAGKPIAVTVSSAGAVAWVQPLSSTTATLRAVVLHGGPPGKLTGTAQILETGSIGKSLGFSGLTLNWTSSGQPKSQALS